MCCLVVCVERGGGIQLHVVCVRCMLMLSELSTLNRNKTLATCEQWPHVNRVLMTTISDWVFQFTGVMDLGRLVVNMCDRYTNTAYGLVNKRSHQNVHFSCLSMYHRCQVSGGSMSVACWLLGWVVQLWQHNSMNIISLSAECGLVLERLEWQWTVHIATGYVLPCRLKTCPCSSRTSMIGLHSNQNCSGDCFSTVCQDPGVAGETLSTSTTHEYQPHVVISLMRTWMGNVTNCHLTIQ